jgi:thymidylate synthase
MARGKCLAETWENSLLELHRNGKPIRTQYDRRNSTGEFIDPPSLDCTMIMVVEDPLAEPFIHRAFPGGLEDLEEYRLEMMEGIKDHWIRDPANAQDKRWEYTYHERLTAYTVPGGKGRYNQLDAVVERLAETPYTRRAQAITWKPWEDLDCYDPPCLQSIWFRLVDSGEGYRLNTNIRFRSRDAYDAAFMNMFALIKLIEEIARRISEKMGRPVRPGRYVDVSDSYHVYGNRLEHFKGMFLKQIETRSFEERTWTREFAEPVLEEARSRVFAKVAQYDRERGQKK